MRRQRDQVVRDADKARRWRDEVMMKAAALERRMEKERVLAERLRVGAERVRESSETERREAESRRVRSEVARAASEGERQLRAPAGELLDSSPPGSESDRSNPEVVAEARELDPELRRAIRDEIRIALDRLRRQP